MLILPTTRMQTEWPKCHPDLRSLFFEFEDYSEKHRLPNPVFTDLVRYRSEQRELYVAHWKKLIRLYKEVGPAVLSIAEREEAASMLNRTDEELAQAAERRFTWHEVRCAVDLRTVGPHPEAPQYKPAELNQVIDFFRDRCRPPLFEFLVHDIHGPHMHIGRRDFSWRQKYADLLPIAGAP